MSAEDLLNVGKGYVILLSINDVRPYLISSILLMNSSKLPLSMFDLLRTVIGKTRSNMFFSETIRLILFHWPGTFLE